MAGVGVATWLYTRFMHRTGGNAKNALFGAGAVGLIVFIVVWSVMSMIDGALG